MAGIVTPHHETGAVTLHHGDCLDVLATLPDASVDAVVTDPPYGLEFMGKEWDAPWKQHADAWTTRDKSEDLSGKTSSPFIAAAVNKYQAGLPFQQWCQLWAAECLRVLKPGGHMLAFGGTRTWHRLACAVEDVGFEVRDSIAWLYGSGFPKSLDVSKAIDKAAGAEREVVGTRFTAKGQAGTGNDFLTENSRDTVVPVTAPATPDAARWQGWGTALKPAFEPIVVARKPLVGTVAANVLAHGTGALNVDGCRIGDESVTVNTFDSGAKPFGGAAGEPYTARQVVGRWPANVVLDESQADALDAMSGEQRDGVAVNRNREESRPQEVADVPTRLIPLDHGFGGGGGASRFFYVAKANADERVRVNGTAHPTVKPLDLMRWLVRLVTPPGGTVLEPFAGSGTTVEACLLEGFRCVAIEREADYLPLIVQRLNRRLDPVAAVAATEDDAGLFGLLDGEPA